VAGLRPGREYVKVSLTDGQLVRLLCTLERRTLLAVRSDQLTEYSHGHPSSNYASRARAAGGRRHGRYSACIVGVTMLAVIFAKIRDLAPYAAMELLLPGGSLMALTLWFYRRRRRAPTIARSSLRGGHRRLQQTRKTLDHDGAGGCPDGALKTTSLVLTVPAVRPGAVW